MAPQLVVGAGIPCWNRANTCPDTRALGVFIIRIQYAEDLSAQDRNGKSDPYIVLAYAKVCSAFTHNSRVLTLQ